MKLFLILSLAVAAGMAAPMARQARQHSIPEGCLFLEESERQEGEATVGEYSYLDPNGNKITVLWEDGPDGYTESRKVLRATPVVQVVEQQVSTQSELNVDALIATIVDKIQPIVIETVRESVQIEEPVAPVAVQVVTTPEVVVEESSDDQLIEKILTVLRSEVVTLVQTAVSEATAVQVQPAVQEVVATTVQVNEQEREAQLIAKIITQLRGVIVTQVREAIELQQQPAPEPVSVVVVEEQPQNQEQLIIRILREIRPLIVRTVQSVLNQANREPEITEAEFNQQVVTRLMPELQVIIRTAIISVRNGVATGDEDRLVTVIISRLQPIIITTIQDVVRSEQASFSQIFATSESFEAFMAKIIVRLRPIILEAVRAAVPKPTPPPTPAPSSLTDVFGASGANFVKVNTKEYQYNYMTDK